MGDHGHTSITSNTKVLLSGLKLISYYPAQKNWSAMWTNWTPATIDADFARIAGLHANTVRIILQAWTIGYPNPQPVMLDRLSQMIRLAAKHDLRVQLTLFDWWNNYSDLTGSRQWATAVLRPYTGDPRLAFVELQNEVDPTNSAFVTWAQQMIPYVRALVPRVPLTASVFTVTGVRQLMVALRATPLDFADFHYYGPAWMAGTTLRSMAGDAAPLPLFIGETGFSSAPRNTGITGLPSSLQDLEVYQDYYYRSVQYAAQALGLPDPAIWTLRDFVPGSLSWATPNSPEYGFGVYRIDDSAKPIASSVMTAFTSGAVDTSFNNGFERCAAGMSPALWQHFQASDARFACDMTIAHTGAASARIGNSRGNAGASPSYYLSPITSQIRPGTTYTATVWARGQAATGTTRLAILWFDAAGKYLTTTASAPLPSGTTPWIQLRVQGTAPTGSAIVQLHLSSAHNDGTAWFDDVTFQ